MAAAVTGPTVPVPDGSGKVADSTAVAVTLRLTAGNTSRLNALGGGCHPRSALYCLPHSALGPLMRRQGFSRHPLFTSRPPPLVPFATH